METAKERRRKIKATSMKVYGAWAPVNAIWPESRHVSIVFFRPGADSGPYTRLYFFSFFMLASPSSRAARFTRALDSTLFLSSRVLENF